MLLITITHRTVEHTDPDAAGFTDGYWWTVTGDDVPHGRIESATATRDASEKFAREYAAGLGDEDVTVVYGDELMSRADDEARVDALRNAS